jgi:precorrin-6B methylase 2
MLKRFCSAATAEVARLERRAHNTRRVRRKRARTLNAVQGVLRGLFGGGAPHYSSFADEAAMRELARIDWAAVPPSVDPLGSNRRGGSARGLRKRAQVSSFLALLRASSCCEVVGGGGGVGGGGSSSGRSCTVVDFGCGTGNLLLPLAWSLPGVSFVGVDLNPRAVRILRERAAAAGLPNVTARSGAIERYDGALDVALALHVCGGATDAALLQATRRGAAFAVAPCCVGKLQDGGMSSLGALWREELQSAAPDEQRVASHAGDEPIARPRSGWMRRQCGRDVYMDIARAADWSGQSQSAPADDPVLSRVPRLCKAAIEADRAAAAEEEGYSVSLMKLLEAQHAGLKDDVLVGFPPTSGDPLRGMLLGEQPGSAGRSTKKKTTAEEDRRRPEVLAAVLRDGDALMYAADEFRADRQMVLAAVRSSVDALLWASAALREDKGVLLAAVRQHGRALRYTSGLRADADVVGAAVRQDGDALQFARGRLKDDAGIVLAAVTQHAWALQHASERLRGDKAVVRAAVRQDAGALKCASAALQRDPEFVQQQQQQQQQQVEPEPAPAKLSERTSAVAISSSSMREDD